jgi:hypothetical protein
MADRLQADLAGLTELSSNLASIATKIDGTQNAFVQASFDIGSVLIEAELENFERTWDVGRKRIHDDIDSLGTMLSDSVKTYKQTDDHLAEALKPDNTPEPESHGRAAV